MKKIKFEKMFNRYYSEDGNFTISIMPANRAKFHGKYSISKKGEWKCKYASTLKEAKEIANEWN